MLRDVSVPIDDRSIAFATRVYRYMLIAHLFVKVPRPGESDGTNSVFESSCHLLLLV